MSSNTVSNADLIEKLEWRYAVKIFDSSKKVSDEDWATLEEALVLSPSSYGLQPYKFIVITDDAMKEKLRPVCFNQGQVTDSSHLVVFAAKTTVGDQLVEDYVELVQAARDTPREQLEGYIGMMKGAMKHISEAGQATAWSQRQAYLSLGVFLETAALIGVDACPMEGFDPAQVDEILGLEGYTASVLCTVGYRSAEDPVAGARKVRFPKEKLIERI